MSSSDTITLLPRMTIIGFGRMGKRCAATFSKGFSVDVLSRRDVKQEAKARGVHQSMDVEYSLSSADYVFLAVPIDALEGWIPAINLHTAPSCVVMDCCTVRLAARARLEGLERPHFGLPEIGGVDLPVDGEIDGRIEAYLKAQGARVYPMPPAGKPVSGIAHFIGMALDLHLEEEDRARLAGGGAGQCLLGLIQHLKTNSPATYRETQLLEPGMSARRKEVIAWLQAVDEELDRGVFRFEPAPPDTWRE